MREHVARDQLRFDVSFRVHMTPDLRGYRNMALMFSDEEFEQAWTELDEPQLDGGWEFFTETMDVKIYRLYNKVNI